MTKPIRPALGQQARTILQSERGIEAIRKTKPRSPTAFAGVPSDAALGLTASSRLPLGVSILNTLTGDVYWRVGEGVGPAFTGVWKKLTPA